MQNDLISRSDAIKRAKAAEIKMESINGIKAVPVDSVVQFLSILPAVDVVVLPKGRPGDYLEWETGIIGHTTIQPIKAILICEDCVRYDLGVFAPTVDHENIVRIMSREDAEQEIERRADDGRDK